MGFSLRRGKTHSSCTNRSPPLRIQSLSFLSTRSVPRRARLTSLTSCRYDTRISWMESERYRCGCFFFFLFSLFYSFGEPVQVRRSSACETCVKSLHNATTLTLLLQQRRVMFPLVLRQKTSGTCSTSLDVVAFVPYLPWNWKGTLFFFSLSTEGRF